jgi:hypothetical protein
MQARGTKHWRAKRRTIDQAKVAFLMINRYRFEDGNESVVLGYRQLIDKQ